MLVRSALGVVTTCMIGVTGVPSQARQALFYHPAELDELRFQLRGESLLGTVRGGEELVESREPQKPADVSQAAIFDQPQHRMQGHEQPKELNPLR